MGRVSSIVYKYLQVFKGEKYVWFKKINVSSMYKVKEDVLCRHIENIVSMTVSLVERYYLSVKSNNLRNISKLRIQEWLIE